MEAVADVIGVSVCQCPVSPAGRLTLCRHMAAVPYVASVSLCQCPVSPGGRLTLCRFSPSQKSLPFLRQSLYSREITIEGVKPPPPSALPSPLGTVPTIHVSRETLGPKHDDLPHY